MSNNSQVIENKQEIVVTEAMIEAYNAILLDEFSAAKEQGLPYLELTVSYISNRLLRGIGLHS